MTLERDYSRTEVAEALGMSPRTVARDWAMARAWLYGELERDLRGGAS